MGANIFGIFLTIGNIPLILLLLIMYINKNQFKLIRTKAYFGLIIATLIYTITEVALFIAVDISQVPGNNTFFCQFTNSVHWISSSLWFYMFFIYCIGFIEDIKEENKLLDLLKKRKYVLIYTIILLVVGLAVNTIKYFNPVSSYDVNAFISFPVKVMIPSLVLLALILIFIFIIIVKQKKKGNINSKFKVVFTVSLIGFIVFYVLQYFIKYVSLSSLLFTIILYLIYYIYENPDLIILNEINESKIETEKSNQTKTDFLSNMSYEIKNPMNMIISICENLNNMPNYDREEVKKYVRSIVDNGNNLLDIINNVLDISKIETGKEQLSESNYKIKDLISNLLDISKQKIGSKPVKLLVNIDQSTSSVLRGDQTKVIHALSNILLNAIKYTDIGRITITLSSSKSNGQEHLLFKISDTGCGIKEEDQTKVFTKGKKTLLNNSKEAEGSGYGLSIAKRYIESMDGKIWFESKYRVGTTFYVEIVQKIIDATPIGSETVTEATSQEQTAKLDCSAYKALIVDDNLLNIKVAKRLLENYKFTVESVTSGRECVDKIKEEQKYDIIFMDHMMPEMDGIETLHVLKKLDGYVLPPIIALTANAIAGMKEMYLNEGFDDYLSKPINTHELDRVINKFMKK